MCRKSVEINAVAPLFERCDESTNGFEVGERAYDRSSQIEAAAMITLAIVAMF